MVVIQSIRKYLALFAGLILFTLILNTVASLSATPTTDISLSYPDQNNDFPIMPKQQQKIYDNDKPEFVGTQDGTPYQPSPEVLAQIQQIIPGAGAPGAGTPGSKPKNQEDYKPSTIERALSWTHNRKEALDELRHPSKPEDESFWKKSLKAPFRIVPKLLSPLSWIKDKTSEFLFGQTEKVVYHEIMDSEIFGKLPKDPEERQQHKLSIRQQAHIGSGLLFKIASPLGNKLTEKVGSYITRQLLGQIISIDGLPDSRYEVSYKNEIMRRIFERFDDKLPEHLRGGKAFEYWKKGHKVYGDAKAIYNLADNTLTVLSLTYEFTGHAQITGKASKMTHLRKLLTFLDIARHCADSYLILINHFNLGHDATQKLNKFQEGLSWFVSIANFICPKRNFVVGLWEMGKMAHAAQAPSKYINKIKEIFTKSFGIEKHDAAKLIKAILKGNGEKGLGILEQYNVTEKMLDANPKLVEAMEKLEAAIKKQQQTMGAAPLAPQT